MELLYICVAQSLFNNNSLVGVELHQLPQKIDGGLNSE